METLALAGRYTLVVAGNVYDTGTASYTFNVQPPVTSNSALTLGQATNGQITTAGGTNSFTFALAAPTQAVMPARMDSVAGPYPSSNVLSWTAMEPSAVAHR